MSSSSEARERQPSLVRRLLVGSCSPPPLLPTDSGEQKADPSRALALEGEGPGPRPTSNLVSLALPPPGPVQWRWMMRMGDAYWT